MTTEPQIAEQVVLPGLDEAIYMGVTDERIPSYHVDYMKIEDDSVIVAYPMNSGLGAMKTTVLPLSQVYVFFKEAVLYEQDVEPENLEKGVIMTTPDNQPLFVKEEDVPDKIKHSDIFSEKE